MHQKYGVNPTPHNQIFYWNPENRLDSLSYDGYYTVRYEYNALGQPVKKYRNGNLDRVWLWDGDQWVAELDASNARVSEYQYSGLDQPYGSVVGSYSPSAIRYHEQDELGNVLGTHDGSTVTQTISYDAWGVPSYSGYMDSRVMWKGLMWEGGPATGDVVGLYYMRGRWYDPQAGRFIQEDPLGVDGGINVYTFSGDDPVNGSDPSGMNPGAEQCIDLFNYGWSSGQPSGVSIHTVCFGGGSGGFSSSPFGNDGDGVGHGGGGGGGNSKNKTETQPKSTRKNKECRFSLGGAGTFGLGLPGGFFTIGGDIGVTSTGRFFAQSYESVKVGMGAYGGYGGSASIGRGPPLTNGNSISWEAEANAGLGESVGGSLSVGQGGDVGMSRSLRYGIGWGAEASIGPVATQTAVSQSFNLLGAILQHLCP